MLNRLHRFNEFVLKKGLFIHFSEGFRRHKKKVSQRPENPDIDRIIFKRAHHQTKDLLHVKQVLGHKNIKNTLVYVQLERARLRL